MGAGAVEHVNISGTNRSLVELEAELADLHGKELRSFHVGLRIQHTGNCDDRKLLRNA